MSREEAISLLSQVNHILVNSNSWLENTHEPLNMAFDMAIKALEQEPILDKIRAEILDNAFSVVNPHNTYEYINVIDLDSIDEIHDKYKAESKDKE